MKRKNITTKERQNQQKCKLWSTWNQCTTQEQDRRSSQTKADDRGTELSSFLLGSHRKRTKASIPHGKVVKNRVSAEVKSTYAFHVDQVHDDSTARLRRNRHSCSCWLNMSEKFGNWFAARSDASAPQKPVSLPSEQLCFCSWERVLRFISKNTLHKHCGCEKLFVQSRIHAVVACLQQLCSNSTLRHLRGISITWHKYNALFGTSPNGSLQCRYA